MSSWSGPEAEGSSEAAGTALRVLHLAPRAEVCGVAKYAGQMFDALAVGTSVRQSWFSHSPYATRAMDWEAFERVAAQLRRDARAQDIVHFQHEFALFGPRQFVHLAGAVRGAGARIVVTLHGALTPFLQPVRLGGLSPGSFLWYARGQRVALGFRRDHVRALRMADRVIAHNQAIADSLLRVGIPTARILRVPMPVPVLDDAMDSRSLGDALRRDERDIVVGVVGFVDPRKGTLHAVRALARLPESYRLAIIGGPHPLSEDDAYLREIEATIAELGLARRVAITGTVVDDARMAALVRECDVCVFPYDSTGADTAPSAALSLALAGRVPAIAYPTTAMREVAADTDAVILCAAPSEEELARELLRVDLGAQAQRAAASAARRAWPVIAREIAAAYHAVAPPRRRPLLDTA